MMKRILAVAALWLLATGCSTVTLRPMTDENGAPIFVDGLPVPELESKSYLQDRDIVVDIERLADGSLSVKVSRRDREKGTDLAEIIKDGIVEGVKIGVAGAGAGGAAAAAGGV